MLVVSTSMKTLTPKVVDTGQKRDMRGRRILGVEERAALLAAYETSGLTQRAFAEREGVKFCTLTTWLARHRREGGAKPKATFIEVRLNGGRGAAALEVVVLPDGLIVRGSDPTVVVALIGQLRRC